MTSRWKLCTDEGEATRGRGSPHPAYSPKAAHVANRKVGLSRAMYARAAFDCPWPLWKNSTHSGTPASIAVEMPPLRALIPEKRLGSTPM